MNQNICPNCHMPVEEGARFCGNCDQPLNSNNPVQVPENNGIPEYAEYQPSLRKHFVSIGLVFGVVGIVSSILVPLFGFVFGFIGLLLVLLSSKNRLPRLKIVSFLACLLAILLGGLFTYMNVINAKNQNVSYSSSIYLVTPCFNLNLSSKFTINNTRNSCNVKFYDGTNINNSEDIYEIIYNNVANLNSSNFEVSLKPAINQDISLHLKNYQVTNQQSTTFVGQMAYYVSAYNKSNNTTVIEEAILPPKPINGNNLLLIIHSSVGKQSNIGQISKSWSWN